MNEGVKSLKVLPQDLRVLVQPKLNTIRTRSYVTIEDFFEKNILQSSVSEFPAASQSFQRYNNYPWTKSTVLLLAHDQEVKDIKSPRYLLNQRRLKVQSERQKKISQNLFSGNCSLNPNKKTRLPPLNLPKKH